MPDTFKSGAEVVAKGSLGPDNVLAVVPAGIMAKCPSKYEMQQRSMAGEAAPHVGKQASPLQTMADKY